jgi:hypothetical protein
MRRTTILALALAFVAAGIIASPESTAAAPKPATRSGCA